MTEAQKALYGVKEPPNIRFGWTREEWQQERARKRKKDSCRKPGAREMLPITIDRLRILASELEHGPRNMIDLRNALGGLRPSVFASLLATAENVGLYLWQEPGVLGCINSRAWLDEFKDYESIRT